MAGLPHNYVPWEGAQDILFIGAMMTWTPTMLELSFVVLLSKPGNQ